MDHGELGRVEKSAAVQAVGRNEVSPLLPAVAEVDPEIGGAKTSIGSRDAALRRGKALTRARGHIDYDARLLAEFRRRRAGNHFHRFDRIEGNLVGEDFALLVRDGLAVDGERVFRMVSQSVEQTIGIGGDSRRRQRYQRTYRG